MSAYRSSLFRSLKKEVSEKLPQVKLCLLVECGSTVALSIDSKDYGLVFWAVDLTNQSGAGRSDADGSPTEGASRVWILPLSCWVPGYGSGCSG